MFLVDDRPAVEIYIASTPLKLHWLAADYGRHKGWITKDGTAHYDHIAGLNLAMSAAATVIHEFARLNAQRARKLLQ